MVKQKQITLLVSISTAALAMALLYFFIYPVYGKYFPKCLMYTFTGLYCPGCGSQRAIVALLHGDIFTALHDNLLAVIALPFLAYSFIVFSLNATNTKQFKIRLFYSPFFVRVVLILVIVFGISRNIPFYPFTLIAPLL